MRPPRARAGSLAASATRSATACGFPESGTKRAKSHVSRQDRYRRRGSGGDPFGARGCRRAGRRSDPTPGGSHGRRRSPRARPRPLVERRRRIAPPGAPRGRASCAAFRAARRARAKPWSVRNRSRRRPYAMPAGARSERQREERDEGPRPMERRPRFLERPAAQLQEGDVLRCSPEPRRATAIASPVPLPRRTVSSGISAISCL